MCVRVRVWVCVGVVCVGVWVWVCVYSQSCVSQPQILLFEHRGVCVCVCSSGTLGPACGVIPGEEQAGSSHSQV